MNAILTADAAELAESGPAIPPAIESVILHCVEKAPEDRFQSAKDIGYALEACAAPLGPLPLAETAASRVASLRAVDRGSCLGLGASACSSHTSFSPRTARALR